MVTVKRFRWLPALLALAAACGDAAPEQRTSGPPPGVASVVITPQQATIPVGQAQQFTATAYDSGGHAMTGVTVEWSVSPSAVAIVDASGRVTAITTGNATLTARVNGVSGTAQLTLIQVPVVQADVTVNPAVTYQTMLGWDAVPNIGHWECMIGGTVQYFNKSVTQRFRDAVIDAAVDLGINRVRLPLRTGAENPVDGWAEFEAGRWDFDDYKTMWYTAVNDDSDPNHINPAGFHFSETKYHVDWVVQPLKQKLEARGEKLYVVLNVVQVARVPTIPFQHRFHPEEYGELIFAAFQFFQNTYGWVPDAVEVINEPDIGNNPWTPQQVGQALAAAGRRLEAAGFRPDFIAPSTVYMIRSVTYLDEMVKIPDVLKYIRELSYHRYGGLTPTALSSIASRAMQYSLRTAMLEHIGSSYENLHADLTEGRNSSWEQYSLAQCGTNDPGGKYIMVDASNPSSPTVRLATRSYYLKQYFKYVRRDAVRIQATSKLPQLDPVAFINRDGRYVVVVKAASAATFGVGGLPPGRYGVFYTTGPNDQESVQRNIEEPEYTLAAGGAVPASIPGKGVITIYAK